MTGRTMKRCLLLVAAVFAFGVAAPLLVTGPSTAEHSRQPAGQEATQEAEAPLLPPTLAAIS
jgi:hypothetical protein